MVDWIDYSARAEWCTAAMSMAQLGGSSGANLVEPEQSGQMASRSINKKKERLATSILIHITAPVFIIILIFF